MAIKLSEKTPRNMVCVDEMKDGQIAEIIQWRVAEYAGGIVQRYSNNLVVIGANWGKSLFSWTDYFGNKHPNNFVRILRDGEQLTVVDNQ